VCTQAEVSYDRRQGFIHSGEVLLRLRRTGASERPPQTRPTPPWWSLRARLRSNPVTRYLYRVLVALAGATVIIVGVVLLPLPGPGWVIIFAGLGIWASEFRWAARLLRWVRARVVAWARWLSRRSPLARTTLTLLLTVLVLGLVSASYIAWRGVPAWVPAWLPLVD
jgi:uncharacterized protein (TIGR02611 family)